MPEYCRGDAITTGKIYRRIYPEQSHYRAGKLTSAVFREAHDDTDGISANLSDLTTPEQVLGAYPGFGLAEVPVEEILRLGLKVTFEPEEGNPGHVVISGQLSHKVRKSLATVSSVIQAPQIQNTK